MIVAAGIIFLAIIALLVYTATRFWRRRWNTAGTTTAHRDEEVKPVDNMDTVDDDERRAA